jgi:hypothetical protein
MNLNDGLWAMSSDFILELIEQEIAFLRVHQYSAAASYNHDLGKATASVPAPDIASSSGHSLSSHASSYQRTAIEKAFLHLPYIMET